MAAKCYGEQVWEAQMARVSVEYENHLAKFTWKRGDKINALDAAMIEAIISAGQEVANSDARAFCAGLDLQTFASAGLTDTAERLMPRSHGDTNQMQELVMVWWRVPVPVIAAVQGAAYGGGLQPTLGADIRIATPDAKLSVMEMKWGLVPDLGGRHGSLAVSGPVGCLTRVDVHGAPHWRGAG